MKKLLFVLIFACSRYLLSAQNVKLTTSGVIAYTKTINMYAILKKNINPGNANIYAPAFEQYKETHPQFTMLNSTLTFANNQTLFKPEISPIISAGFFAVPPIVLQNNIVHANYNTKRNIIQKIIFEDTYLLKDSISKIRWKLTDEVREIAGYSCRRANAIILDSIYVVAFYTDEIPVSGGPESFNGLPGMILQVAIPHENISWVATKITVTTNGANAILPPQKGKIVDKKELMYLINELSKKRNGDASANLKAFTL